MTYQIPKIIGEHTCDSWSKGKSIDFADNGFDVSATVFTFLSA
jgi:hypothetical protein